MGSEQFELLVINPGQYINQPLNFTEHLNIALTESGNHR